MTRREELERIIIGSVLTNAAYAKDIMVISPTDIEDLVNREIFLELPRLAHDAGERMPLDVLFEEQIEAGREGSIVTLRALELSCTDDFDVKKAQYNIDALTDYYFHGKVYRPTAVEFRDYITQFIRLTYGATTR